MAKRGKVSFLTVEEYLKAEESAFVRHEYIGGQVFAMTGATAAHNLICGNLFASLYSHLRGSSCRPFMNDMKVRIQSGESFYYPDIMVTCGPIDNKAVFDDSPVLIVEVLSPSTKVIDRREKLFAYKQIGSLRQYVVVYQDRQRMEVYDRQPQGHWELTIIRSGDILIIDSFEKGTLRVPVSDIYDNLNIPPIVEESDVAYEFYPDCYVGNADYCGEFRD